MLWVQRAFFLQIHGYGYVLPDTSYELINIMAGAKCFWFRLSTLFKFRTKKDMHKSHKAVANGISFD